MKKLFKFLCIALFISVNSYSQLAIKKSQDTLNGIVKEINTRLDSVVMDSKCYVASMSFTASSVAGAYSNLTAISSSTASGSSFSLSVPNGKYELMSINAVITSSAAPIFEGWIFTSSVTTAGDKVAISGVLTDTDMKKFCGDFRFDGTGVGNGTTFKYNGRISSLTLNVPIIVNVTDGKIHFILIARTGWTPTVSAAHTLLFYLRRHN